MSKHVTDKVFIETATLSPYQINHLLGIIKNSGSLINLKKKRSGKVYLFWPRNK